ncbi:hypothetical protein Syun_024694 [Stephania yunnanensis]|uniref:Uncharacterized protein n=1 Tax=Stephania yunnanensis TaxID=152371 RepID=A0AAP0HTX2_9MAGN
MALRCGGGGTGTGTGTGTGREHPLGLLPLVSPIPKFSFNLKLRKKEVEFVVPHLVVSASSSSAANSKIANLFAKRKERVKLASYEGGDGRGGIDQFLCHPSGVGVEAILNKNSFTTFQSLDTNTYRCTLPKLNFLNFQVAPVLDLRVTPTTQDCTIELLSCKFEGSEVLQRQNDRFSACMRNHISWDVNDSEQFLDLDIELNVSLEIYTQPFSSLPISAVEKPGNLMMQSLLDRLFQVLLQQLLLDYDCWVREGGASTVS